MSKDAAKGGTAVTQITVTHSPIRYRIAMQPVLAVPTCPKSNPTCPCIQEQPVPTHLDTGMPLQQVHCAHSCLDQLLELLDAHPAAILAQLLGLHLGMQGEDGVTWVNSMSTDYSTLLCRVGHGS